MRIALNQSCLPGLTTSEFVAIAAEIGAEGVELRLLGFNENPTTIGLAARAGGLPVDSVGPLMDWSLPDDPDRSKELEDLLEIALNSGLSCHRLCGTDEPPPVSPRPRRDSYDC